MTMEAWSEVFYKAGQWAGLIGYATLAAALVLTSRAHFLDRRLGGLPRLYRAHHRAGLLSFLMILAHPILLALSVGLVSPAALSMFLSLDNALMLSGWVSLFILVLVVVTSLTKFLHYEPWRYLHLTSGIAFGLAVWHAYLGMEPTPIYRVWVAGFGAIGAAAFFYREVFVRIGKRRHRYLVASVRDLGAKLLEISLNPKDIPIAFHPGQFVYVTFYSTNPQNQKTHVPRESHPFSIASAPEEKGIQLIIKVIGDFTQSLKTLEIGTSIALVEGPYGNLLSGFDSKEQSPQLWIAGGIGIAPFLSVLRSSQCAKVRADFHLFWKAPEHDVFGEELARLSRTAPGLRIFTHYDSTEGIPSVGAIERLSGPVTAKSRIVLCGPSEMSALLRREMKKLGVPSNRIRSEEFHFR